jgi:hypothetical protein
MPIRRAVDTCQFHLVTEYYTMWSQPQGMTVHDILIHFDADGAE